MAGLTFEEAHGVARTSRAPPGRVRANEVLKACREELQNRCGGYIDFEKETRFHWQAYLAMHPSAQAIFSSAITGFLCETFPEKEPNAAKLPGLNLRTDFVCLRADGSAVRLHPSKGAEAKIAVGNLESWRSGTTPLFDLDVVLLQSGDQRGNPACRRRHSRPRLRLRCAQRPWGRVMWSLTLEQPSKTMTANEKTAWII